MPNNILLPPNTGIDAPYVEVGTVTLHETHTFREDTSYAAWYRMVEVTPQTVPLQCNGYYLRYDLLGKIVGGNLDARFGGVAVTANTIDREIGNEWAVIRQPYAYQYDELADGHLHAQHPEFYPNLTMTLQAAS